MVIDNSMSARTEITKTIQYEKEYPDPTTLPAQPSWQQPRPQLTLSELGLPVIIEATVEIAI